MQRKVFLKRARNLSKYKLTNGTKIRIHGPTGKTHILGVYVVFLKEKLNASYILKICIEKCTGNTIAGILLCTLTSLFCNQQVRRVFTTKYIESTTVKIAGLAQMFFNRTSMVKF